MTTEINLVGEKYSFLMNTSFLNKYKVKFLQMKQDTIRQKRFQKNLKRNSVSVYIHMRRNTLSPCAHAAVQNFDDPTPSPTSCLHS